MRLNASNWRVMETARPAAFWICSTHLLVKSVRAFAVLEQIAIAADDGQQIIEVVRDAARQPAHGFHLVGLPQPFLELLLLLLRVFQAGAHADESVGDFRDFVAAARFQRITEIALPQSANAGNQARQRLRDTYAKSKKPARCPPAR